MAGAKKVIDYWSPYILGETNTPPKTVGRATPYDYESFLEILASDSVVKSLFDSTEVYSDFYDCTVDLKRLYDKSILKDLFYTAKVMKYNPMVPGYCVFMIEKAWKLADGIPNLITKYISSAAFEEFTSEGYLLGGLNLRDVICSLTTSEYYPLSIKHPKNKLRSFAEIYIADTDMVAAVPNDIADELTDEAICDIRVDASGLKLGTKYLRTMHSHFGITNSIYDLRELI